MLTYKRALLTATTITATLLLTGCGASHQSTLEAECVKQAAIKAGVAEDTLTVTERIKSPAGSLDWRGTYEGGEFACAGAMDTDELFQVVTYSVE